MTARETELKKIEELLIDQKNKLEDDLDLISKPNSENREPIQDDLGDDNDENATEVDAYVDNLALVNNLENQLNGVDASLQKIKEGNFGDCEECKNEISLERLSANPSAKRCMECASK